MESKEQRLQQRKQFSKKKKLIEKYPVVFIFISQQK